VQRGCILRSRATSKLLPSSMSSPTMTKKSGRERESGMRGGNSDQVPKKVTRRVQSCPHEHTASAFVTVLLVSVLPHHIMKLSAAAFSLFLFVSTTNAQYFSVGWSPGQKVSSQSTPAESVASSSSQTAVPAATENTPSTWTPNSFIEKLLASGPAVALLSSLGLNVSAALNEKLWDERIQLITDENYQDVIVNETLTPKEEKERAWVILMYVCHSPHKTSHI